MQIEVVYFTNVAFQVFVESFEVKTTVISHLLKAIDRVLYSHTALQSQV